MRVFLKNLQKLNFEFNQISTLNGAFTYTTAGGNDEFIFKGVLVGWYVSTVKQNTPFLLSDFICLPAMGR